MEFVQDIFLLLYLLAAAVMDISTRKIRNSWIITGLVSGVLFQFMNGGLVAAGYAAIRMLIPLVLLILFALGVLGAGDIKLLMVTAVFLTKAEFFKVLLLAFGLGSIGALWKLIKTRSFKKRFAYFGTYIMQIAATGKVVTYRKKEWENSEIIHISVYIFLATALVIGGVV